MKRSYEQLTPMEELILAFFDHELDAAGQRRLANMLAESNQARELFDSYMRLEGISVELGRADCLTSSVDDAPLSSPRPVTDPPAEVGSRRRIVRRWAVRMALTAVAISVGALIAIRSQPADTTAQRLPSVGHITRMVAAEWVTATGDATSDLAPGAYELRDGLVELEFNNGATVILEGPAEFEVISDERTYLKHGKIRTLVPPEAFGFVIETPAVKIVDLGTEFGLNIDHSGSGEIHVFDGEVEIYKRLGFDSSDRTLLVAGEAVRVDVSGHLNGIPADFDAFVDGLTLETRAAAYVDEMALQLTQIEAQLKTLNTELKRAESRVREMPELQRLKRAVNDAKHRWTVAQKEDAELQVLVRQRDMARTALNRLYREAIEGSEYGRELKQMLDDANATLNERKRQLIAAKEQADQATQANRVDRLDELHRQLRRSQANRRQARAAYRAFQDEIGQSDPKLREAIAELARARDRIKGHLAAPRFDKLRNEETQRRKAFLAQQRRRLGEDRQVRELRAQLRELRQRQRSTKRKMQQARQATMTMTAFEMPAHLGPWLDPYEPERDETE